MLRNYALTFLAVTSRVLVPVFLLVQVPFGGVDAGSAETLIPVGQAAGWIINLLVVELLLRRGQRPPTRSPRRTKRFATRRDAPAA
ncbi:hypothetical protein Amsp01_008670 [Amycolatopsis sp. NBRC 101858]|nr:hypothetical protein Amsp01_008670 [Amycolatopsis sp. NBRC 101858]